MSGLSNPLQGAIYAAVKAAIDPTPIYDAVPEETAYPYVTLGDDTAQEWDTKTDAGEEVTLVLHQWSRAQGRKEIKDLQKKIYAALHNVDLNMTTGKIVLLQWQMSDNFLDQDGVTKHGVMHFRALLVA